MKNNILLVAISILSLVACKKDVSGVTGNTGTVSIVPASAVPAAVVAAFNSSFSTATETEWQHNSDDSFTCQFNMDDQRHEAHFDDKGHQSSHSVICLDGAVPATVLNAFRAAYPTDNVYEWKFTTDQTWKAHFMRDNIKWEVTFNANGTVVKAEHD
ncbi:hypothetical protein FRZ67_00970 [Panacibacter ginsenosidivorans]|uniref:Uncharacterized protein n=1 Tax=Panacibacter ginsenosidivorans TaxID=1813871 RepID=A0A5B8V409_9BACT|nr:PepSY-like domain-containing protein [Panacibacter ginsenosidivorans]QEC65942.1 hypothetical protein FRZ67_00970 [Panacibacter ginsenosidivorans]